MTTAQLLTLADLDVMPLGGSTCPQIAPAWNGPERLTGAALLTRCTPDLTAIDRAEIGTERAGNTGHAIAQAMTDLLDGLALRCAGDETALAAIGAIRDWHLPDLRALARH